MNGVGECKEIIEINEKPSNVQLKMLALEVLPVNVKCEGIWPVVQLQKHAW